MQAQVSNDSDVPRTPPRRRSEDGEEHNAEGDEDSSDHDIEAQDDDDYESRKVQRGRRKWEMMATFDRTAMLDSEASAAIQRIADEKMEQSGLVKWPSARIPSKCIGL